jgi:TorA maturation chaperone TorD
MNETKTQSLLRNAKQALAYYRQQEDEARKALAMAAETTRKAKEKYEALFTKEQNEAVANYNRKIVVY